MRKYLVIIFIIGIAYAASNLALIASEKMNKRAAKFDQMMEVIK
jgi:hypothetical protein